MTKLTTIDLPTLRRATIGFDRFFSEMERQYVNSQSQGYPPYNIAMINEDEYVVVFAVAGFGMDNLEITKEGNILRVEGVLPKDNDKGLTYFHKGIASRSFRKDIPLADHMEVVNAKLELGMLSIHIKREIPEALQPKKIKIEDYSGTTISN